MNGNYSELKGNHSSFAGSKEDCGSRQGNDQPQEDGNIDQLRFLKLCASFVPVSCFQVKSPAQLDCFDDEQFQWQTLFERKLSSKVEVEKYSLPVWAGTWKFMNFPYRQQKKNWDYIWPEYQQKRSNRIDTFDKIQNLKEQVRILFYFTF